MKPRSCRLTASILVLSLMICPLLYAGQLAPDVGDQLAVSGSNEPVTVWIKLQKGNTGQEIRRLSASAILTAKEKHSAILDRLKADHRRAQENLLADLRRLEASGAASDIRTFWITNTIVATVSAAELERLAARSDVDMIYSPPIVRSIRPQTPAAPALQSVQADSIAPHLEYISADQAWAQGYSGAGRLVCLFDSGIDGDHPAFASRWKGLDGDWEAAWFDPVGKSTSPELVPGSFNSSHGTNVLGLMAGDDPTNGFRTGVAYEAQWISAAVTDLPDQVSHAILEAFEWAADPDGDPNTVADRPDVINHSWGFTRQEHDVSCEDIFFDAIDNIEALGIVCIFSAGNNGGSGAMTIANPANRSLDSIDCFAVGATRPVDGWSNPTSVFIASFSSEGPSDCDAFSTKPNLVAPGQEVRTSSPGGSYVSQIGTSFSAPQVSGLVALMREKNPNATVPEIKTAILNTARKDNFSGHKDNEWGWGELDCLDALNAIPAVNADPHVRVYAFDHDPISPGDTLEGTIVLQNIGANATNVSGTLSSLDPRITVLDGTVTFGSIDETDTVRSAETVRLAVSESARSSEFIAVPLSLSVSGENVELAVSVLAGPRPGPGIATHSNSRLDFTVSNFGMYGFGPFSLTPVQGSGFTFEGSDNFLWECGLMITEEILPVRPVVSGVHSYIYASDYDFRPASEGNLTILATDPRGAQYTKSAFTDANSADAIGLYIEQETFSFNAPDDDFVVLKFAITNNRSTNIDEMYFGMLIDWDVYSYQANAGGWEPADEYLWCAYNSGDIATPVLSLFRGAALLEGQLSSAMTDLDDLIALPAFFGNGFIDNEKSAYLKNGTLTQDTYKSAKDNLFQVLAAGPLALAPGESDTVAISIGGGQTLTDLANAFTKARTRYLDLPTDVTEPEDIVIPEGFSLLQNYPNPFNPVTTISFTLPQATDFRVRVINALGQVVDEISGAATVGQVMVQWDGSGYASGVYLYEVQAGEYNDSRKMLLLK